MPGATGSAYPSNTTQAQFQAWATVVASGLVTAGMVKTADTGQTAPGSLPASAAINTLYGYEIYRFADTLQSTNPVFLRVEYRSGSQASYPLLAVRVGTATDGAGNLASATAHPNTVLASGNVLDTTTYPFVNPTTVMLPIYTFGHSDGAAVGQLLFPSQGSGSNAWGGGFLVERSRDPDGTPTGRGLIFVAWYATSNNGGVQTQQFIYNWAGTQPASLTNYGIGPYNNATTAVEGSAVYPYPFFTGTTPRVNAPSKILTVAGRTDIPAATQYSMTHYAEAGTWVSMGNGGTAGNIGFGYFTGNSASGIQSPQMRIA